MVRKWEIYFCNLNPTIGSEQQGFRPCLVISSDIVNKVLPIATVLPISSFKEGSRIYPSEVLLPKVESGLPKDSIVMIQQIRTVSTKRLFKPVGSIHNYRIRDKVLQALINYFDFPF